MPPMNFPKHPFDDNLTLSTRSALSWADWFAGAMLLPALCLWTTASVLPIEFLWSSQAAQELERLIR